MQVPFFMIVTGDRDAYIADYCIKSFSLIKNIDIKLIIYSNYVSTKLKKMYFPIWIKYPYVQLISNDHHDDEKYVKTDNINYQEGRFDIPGKIWDKELKKIDSEFIGIVDADCEILNPNTVYDYVKILQSNNNLLAVTSHFFKGGISKSSKLPPPIKDLQVTEQPQYGHFFIIYRKKNIDFNISTQIRWEIKENNTAILWDTHSYLQNTLINKGLKIKVLNKKYSKQIIHYGGFAKNTVLNENNIVFYRRIRILRHVGFLNIPFSNILFKIIHKFFFNKSIKDRNQLHQEK